MRTVPSVTELESVGRRAGLDAFGVAHAGTLVEARRAIEDRKASGMHAGMQFTFRNPARSTEPGRIIDGAQAVVVGARRYRRQDAEPTPGPTGEVARYVRGDHYGELRRSLGEVARRLRSDGWRAQVVCDDNALVDRAIAHRAGLGWFGKNANVLVPGVGSWVVLGSVVTDAPLPTSSGPVADGCGTCRRCIDACPTSAIVATGVVDARRCLAWLVQAAGTFPLEHRAALGGRLYGCDDCQEVCPPNRTTDRKLPPPAAEGAAGVPLLELLDATDEQLLRRHGHWYIARRDPRYLRRNALVALGNVGDARDARVVEVIDRYAHGGDELLAEHARWASSRLAERSLVAAARAGA